MKAEGYCRFVTYGLLIIWGVTLLAAKSKITSLETDNQHIAEEMISLQEDLNAVEEDYSNLRGYNNFLESQNKMLMQMAQEGAE